MIACIHEYRIEHGRHWLCLDCPASSGTLSQLDAAPAPAGAAFVVAVDQERTDRRAVAEQEKKIRVLNDLSGRLFGRVGLRNADRVPRPSLVGAADEARTARGMDS